MIGVDFSVYQDPVLRYDITINKFRLVEDLITPEHSIPAGTLTDGASRPCFTEIVGVERYGRHLYACIVHDWMYANAIATKREADDLFFVNLGRCGIEEPMRTAMYKAVRYFGKGAYPC